MTVTTDHARPSPRPDTWKMTTVLGVASTLGVIGVVASFVLCYIAEQVLHFDRGTTQSLMYLKLSVAGQVAISS